jgi:hypothetical protein
MPVSGRMASTPTISVPVRSSPVVAKTSWPTGRKTIEDVGGSAPAMRQVCAVELQSRRAFGLG